MQEFRNEPFTDFSDAANKKAMEQALAKVEGDLAQRYSIIINGERIKTGVTFDSVNPSAKAQVIGTFEQADENLAKQAIETAATKFEDWKKTPAAERSEYLFKAAKIIRERKHEFSAWMVYEAGKSWPEADADTAETIDFLDFYARENLRYAEKQPLTPVDGEANELVYIPLGVGAVIPPWNFPFAIMAGMATAAVVTGNTVVLKPSSDAPTIAYKFMEVMEEVGLPAGVINFLPGPGSSVGNTMVEHPKTRFISFTGSKEVGLGINAKAARMADGQIWIKRIVAEMGGKDGIVVDKDCDLDAAVQGVWASAFGFSGQKCSACSRAMIHQDVYDEFLEKLTEKTKQTKFGNTTNPDNFTGPVINQAAFDKIMSYIEIGNKEGRLLAGGNGNSNEGYFVEPTVFADVSSTARLAQEEIFGPVLAVIKVKDFDEGLKVANNTEYGLTGAVYTNNKDYIKRTKEEFHVGNLYINRKCTGALVGAQPFGGFNMSGTDSKAGGRDYLLLFQQAKVWSEKN